MRSRLLHVWLNLQVGVLVDVEQRAKGVGVRDVVQDLCNQFACCIHMYALYPTLS